MTTVDPTRAGQNGSREDGAARRIRVPAQRGSGEEPGGADKGTASRARRLAQAIVRLASSPVSASLAVAALLHLLWVALLANSGGDLAAQDAWAEFALQHPDSAYNLAWYGGMHPVSYSVISPYLMAILGVRTTMMIAGTLSAGLLALLLVRSRVVRRPLWPALYGTFALACNAISGRVTFGLGMMFGLAAVAVIFAWPVRWRSHRWHHKTGRALLGGLMAALATMSSPVAGLFVGIVAAALWLTKRRPAAYVLGIPPAIVVGLSAWLFPFSGKQPMPLWAAVLPFLTGLVVYWFSPKEWRTVRVGSILYAIGTVLAFFIPSQIGTNITRLSLIFGGVVLLAELTAHRTPARAEVRRTWAGRKWMLLVTCVAGVTVWQGVGSGVDIIHTTPSASWNRELAPLVDRLEKIKADRGRVEVVPVRSHRESSALAPYVNLARGWNRQRDLDRNPLFYEDTLSPLGYHDWLKRWAVHYVVLPADEPDPAAKKEAELIDKGLPYLRKVWSDSNWRLYAVADPTEIAGWPATVRRAGPDELTLRVEHPGPVLIRIPYSPWLGLVDGDGDVIGAPDRDGAKGDDGPAVNRHGCLTKQIEGGQDGQPEDEWTVLHAPKSGTYRIAGRYQLPRGTPCPDDMVTSGE